MSETAPALTTDAISVSCENGDSFTFRLPGARDYARIGARAHELRRQDSPSTGGADFGLDYLSQDLYRGFALFEVLLAKADAKNNWPYTADATGKPVVDSAKFPAQAIPVIPEAYRKFEAELSTFLSGGPAA
jgi:hypothetical protein